MSIVFYAGSPGAIPPGYRIAAAILLRRIGRAIDNWVAGIIARREREVASATFHGFTEGAPQDAGVPKARSMPSRRRPRTTLGDERASFSARAAS